MTGTAQIARDTTGRRKRTTGGALAAFGLLTAGGCAMPTTSATHASVTESTLGTAQSFTVFAGSTVTNTGATTVGGSLGVDPGLAITGFPPGLVEGGTIHTGDAVALQALDDITAAYDAVSGEAPTLDLSGQDLGGKTLTAGVYHFASSAELTGALTLDAQHDPDAMFVFQIGSALTTASNASVVVINGGADCNVFWQVGSSATLGTTTTFAGNVLALTSITLDTGARVSGRALARNAAVTMDTNHVSTVGCSAATGHDAGVAADSHRSPDAAPLPDAAIAIDAAPADAAAPDAAPRDAGCDAHDQ